MFAIATCLGFAALASTPEPPRASNAAPPANEPTLGEFPHATGGLYPLWEDTGDVLGHQHVALGLTSASVGFADRAEVGVKPQTFILRVPNAFVKVPVYHRHGFAVSTRLSALAILSGAEKRFWSSTYTSTVPTSQRTLWVVPLSGSLTWEAHPALRLHGTLTAMGIFGRGKVQNSLTAGYFSTAEFLALAGHSLFVHVGEIGMWDHDQWVLGGSYRFNYRWLEMRLGYFYWWRRDGLQSGPIANISVLQ